MLQFSNTTLEYYARTLRTDAAALAAMFECSVRRTFFKSMFGIGGMNRSSDTIAVPMF